jgi:hypothetical protein
MAKRSKATDPANPAADPTAATAAAAPAAPTEKAPPKPKVVLVKQNDVTQPREGGKTRKVWDVADYLHAELKRVPYLQEVRDKIDAYNAGPGKENPVGKGTVDANYLVWRKFHGHPSAGRMPAPAKPAEATTEA